MLENPIHSADIEVIVLIVIMGVVTVSIAAVLFNRVLDLGRKNRLDAHLNLTRIRRAARILILVVVSVISLVTYLLLDYNRTVALKNARNTLQTVRDSTAEGIEAWIGNRKVFVKGLGENPRLVRITESLLQSYRRGESLAGSAALVESRRFFSQEGGLFVSQGYFIIAPDAISIASRRNENIGTTNLIAQARPDLFARVLAGETLFVPPLASDVPLTPGAASKGWPEPTMFVAAPVVDGAGQVIAVVTQRLDPKAQFAKLLQVGRIGESGETYLISRQGVMLSASRFEDQLHRIGLLQPGQESALNVRLADPGRNLLHEVGNIGQRDRWPLNPMVERLLQERRAAVDVVGYRDYRGVDVFGAWVWVEGLDAGLVTEIDRAEALHEYHLLAVTLVGAMTVAVALFASVISLLVKTGVALNRTLKEAHDDLDQRVRERTEEIQAIVNAAADGILTIDDQGLIRSFNPAAQTIFGYSAEEMVGQSLSCLIPAPYRQRHEAWFRQVTASGEPQVVGKEREVSGQRRGGVFLPLQISIGRVTTREGGLFIAIVRDITERKKTEQQLNAAKEAAEAANQAKSEFLANMSHELRTPMHGILGFAELGVQRMERAERDKLRRYFEQIHSSGERLLNLLNDLLDLSKLEARMMVFNIEPVVVQELIDLCVNELRATFEARAIVLVVENQLREPLVACDSERLVQVVTNLLANAIKFSPEGSEIKIILENVDRAERGEMLRVVVEDRGVGIPDDELETIFDKFIQSSKTNTGAKGTGLGLAICREIISHHHGAIWAANRSGGGARFIFEIPLDGGGKREG